MASIRKRGDTFTITSYLGYSETGKQIKKTTTFRPPDGVTNGKAEKLAREFAIKWEDKVRGFVALDENRTLSELAQWYYETIAPNTLKPNVLIGYKQGIYNHIIPRIGRVKLKDITPQMLDSLFRELQTAGNLEISYKLLDCTVFDEYGKEKFIKDKGVERATFYGLLRGRCCRGQTAEKIAAALGLPLEKVFDDATEKRGMSGASVNKLKLNLSAIFTAACRKEIMRRNPCKLVTPPKVDTPPAAFLDEEQSRRLLAAAREQSDFQLEVIINLFLAAGIRSGELTALHWPDLDFNTGVLFVQHTLVRIDGAFVRQTTKTTDSTRRIVLPAYILKLLAEHRQRQAEYRASLGDVWKSPDDIMFANLSGDYLNGINLNRKLKDVVKAAGLPDIHLHSLRHTHASLLINSDVTARLISDRLGHSTTKTTLDTYAHIFSASEVKAMQAVEMSLFPPVTETE